jgi:hypothetical protein
MNGSFSNTPLPEIFVGKAVVTARVKNFLTVKYPKLNETLNGKDTRAVWYSREHLETILDEMRMLSADGLRVYFGAYEDTHKSAPGQVCLLLVPTRASANDGHADVIIEDESGFAERVNLGEQSKGIFDNTNLPSTETEEEQSKGFNYGHPCPPYGSNIDDMKYGEL